MFKKLFKNTTFFFSLLLLSSCDANEIGDRIKTTVFDMLPNLWVTLIQLTIFILVVILFMIFAYKPLKKKLNERSEYIEKNIKDSENAKKEAQGALNKANEIILNSQKEAGEIVQNAQFTAQEKVATVEKELATNIEHQKELAHIEIQNERKKMLEDSKTEIVDTAFKASEQILKREVKKDDHDKFVDEFIEEMSKTVWTKTLY